MPDDVTLQRERIERIAKEIEPDCDVDFIMEQDARIRFRIFDKGSGRPLVERSGGWEPSRLAGLSDDALAQVLRILSEMSAEE
jgi:hypothetical protein